MASFFWGSGQTSTKKAMEAERVVELVKFLPWLPSLAPHKTVCIWEVEAEEREVPDHFLYYVVSKRLACTTWDPVSRSNNNRNKTGKISLGSLSAIRVHALAAEQTLWLSLRSSPRLCTTLLCSRGFCVVGPFGQESISLPSFSLLLVILRLQPLFSFQYCPSLGDTCLFFND